MRESGQLYGEPTERTAVGPPQALRGFVRSVGEDCPSGLFVLSSRVGGPGEESGAVLVLLLRSARSTRSALGAPVGGKQRFRCGSACDGRHEVRRRTPRRQRRRTRAAATAAAMSSATCMLEADGGAAAAQRARTCVCVSSTARLHSTWQAQKSTTKATGEGSGRRFNERVLTRLPPRVAAYWRALRLLRLSLTCACGSRTPSSRSR